MVHIPAITASGKWRTAQHLFIGGDKMLHSQDVLTWLGWLCRIHYRWMIVKRSRDFVVSFRVFCHKIASSECEREKARRREEQQQPQYVCQQHVQDWRLRLCRRWARQVPYYLAQPVKHYFLQSFWCPAHWRTTEVCLWKCWNGGELPNINAFSITCVNLIFKGDDLLKKNWLAQRSSPRGWRESQR